MPIHDWTRVSAGTFHALHTVWIGEIQGALNGGVLPHDYYALAEQATGPAIPDVLTLQATGGTEVGAARPTTGTADGGGIALATAPPRVAVCDTVTESMLLAARRRQLVIRHQTGDRIVAVLEIASPGNKERRPELRAFVDKAVGVLDEGYHLMVIDLIPPGQFDPKGIHGAIWERLHGSYDPPAGKPLTLAAYVAAGAVTCFVEPASVGATLIDMPLFLDAGHYVNVPLEPTYMAAYAQMPQRWKTVIEAGG